MGTQLDTAVPRRRRRRGIGVAALALAGAVLGPGCAADSSEVTLDAEGSTQVDKGGADTSTSAPTSTETTEAPTASSSVSSATAGDPVALLRVAPETDGGVPYDRDDYDGWTTGADGCRTRDTVLIRDARPPGAQVDPYGCRVLAGEWTDPYTNEAVFADDAGEVSDLVHVDHVVALAEAHRSGGWRWDRALRRDFANDLDNLLATAASVNISKSDRDPSSWQPPATDRWCRFTEIWIQTKLRWDLAADPAEADALANMRSARSCPDDFAGGLSP